MPSAAFDRLYPKHDCPDLEFLEMPVARAELEEMHSSALRLIRDGYSHFAERSTASAAFMRALQERHAELSAREDYEGATAFVEVADEIAALLGAVDSLQRTVVFGALHTDMKPAKIAARDLLRAVTQKIRAIAIARTRVIFEQIEQVKDLYVRAVGMNQMIAITGPTPDLIEYQAQINALCAVYFPIAECILAHWADAAMEIKEQYGSAQDIRTTFAPVMKVKRKGKGRRRPAEVRE